MVAQTIAERRSKSAALRAALSKVGARARAALFKKDGSASASGALKKGRAQRAPLIFLICALKVLNLLNKKITATNFRGRLSWWWTKIFFLVPYYN